MVQIMLTRWIFIINNINIFKFLKYIFCSLSVNLRGHFEFIKFNKVSS